MSTVVEPQQTRHDDSLPSGDILYEMVDGKLVEKDVSTYAAWIATLLSCHLSGYCNEHRLGMILTENVFILSTSRRLRRRPDVAFVSANKWPIDQPPPPTGDWDLIPDIAIEVTSPNDAIAKVTRKKREYFRYGVMEVWVIIPEERLVQVHRSMNDVTTFGAGEEIRSEMLPGWSMAVRELLPHELEAELDDV